MTGPAILAALLLVTNVSAGPSPWTAGRSLRVGQVRALAAAPAAGAVVELAVELAATFDNPFDPRQVAVDAAISGPAGTRIDQPAFFMVPYTRSGEGVVLAAAGEWRIRFTPATAGEWRVTVRARDRTGKAGGGPFRIAVAPSDAPGMIRVSPRDNRYFEYASGRGFFPIGLNTGWAEERGLSDFDAWFEALGKAGGNWARMWMIHWWCALEGRAVDWAEYHGPGVYSMENAARVDEVFASAARNGINIMLCLDSFNWLRKHGNDAWDDFAYNAANGGPLKEERDFWTDAEAKRLYLQRLRYLVARWGARPNLFAWEFWNEVDGIDDYESELVAPWHAEMARALRALDPYGHIITTSSGGARGDPAIWSLPGIDFVQAHAYNLTDTASSLAQTISVQRKWGKPALVGEFGAEVDEGAWIRSGGDKQGVHFATALWGVSLSEAAGTPMIWYWGNYVHRFGLWRHFKAFADFIRGVDFPGERFRAVPRSALAFRTAPRGGGFRAAVLRPDSPDWGSRQGTFRLLPDGTLDPSTGLSTYLYGDGKEEYRSALILRGEFREETKVRVHVMRVSGLATLTVAADGATVYSREFKPGPGKGEWKRVRYRKQWDNYENTYDREYEARIPAGTKEVRIENTNGDWMTIGSVIVDPGLAAPRPPLDVYGLAGERSALVYLKHSDLTWVRAMSGPELDSVAPTVMRLPVSGGKWHVTLVDPDSGKKLKETDATAGADGMAVDLPRVKAAIAVRADRL